MRDVTKRESAKAAPCCRYTRDGPAMRDVSSASWNGRWPRISASLTTVRPERVPGLIAARGAYSAQVAGVSQRVTSRLRPHGQSVGFLADLDLGERAVARVETIDDASKRPDSHSALPSALTLPMSGLPPPGIGHCAVTLPLAKSTTVTLPPPCGLP